VLNYVNSTPMGRSDATAAIRARAGIARRLAGELKEPHSIVALNEIAAALESEADSLECNVIQMKKPPRNDR
jgi:hypothetical protein